MSHLFEAVPVVGQNRRQIARSQLPVTRTTIDIDAELVARVMRLHNLKTKRQAVDYALRRLDTPPLTRNEILGLEGMGWGEQSDPSDLAAGD